MKSPLRKNPITQRIHNNPRDPDHTNGDTCNQAPLIRKPSLRDRHQHAERTSGSQTADDSIPQRNHPRRVNRRQRRHQKSRTHKRTSRKDRLLRADLMLQPPADHISKSKHGNNQRKGQTRHRRRNIKLFFHIRLEHCPDVRIAMDKIHSRRHHQNKIPITFPLFPHKLPTSHPHFPQKT